MAEKSEKPEKPKKNIMGLVLPLLAFVAGAGAGGAGAAIAVLQFAGGGGDHGKATHAEAPPPPAGPLEYAEIENAFTSNLADSGRYLQLKLSVSTFGSEAATAALAKHKPALVSAVLAALGEVREADIENAKAKDALRARIKDVMNNTLKTKGEAGIVEEVFFTSLVVQ
jgi:flagellar basal body-associated protein FliL